MIAITKAKFYHRKYIGDITSYTPPNAGGLFLTEDWRSAVDFILPE